MSGFGIEPAILLLAALLRRAPNCGQACVGQCFRTARATAVAHRLLDRKIASATRALDDEDRDVRWVAAESLIVLGKTGLMTSLSGLTKRAQSTAFCQSAHHVLREMVSRGYADVVAPVLGALEGSEPGVGAPPATYCALVALKHGAKS